MPHTPKEPEPPLAALAAAHMYTDPLMRLPNVIGVGVAYKVVEGQRTDTVSVSVKVIRKERAANLATLDRVPSSLTFNGEGIPTDVMPIAMPRVCQFMYDFAKHRPIRGGCMIEAVGQGGGMGTGGGIFYDRRWPMEPVLLTNSHVLSDARNNPPQLPQDIRVYQPPSWWWGEYIGYIVRAVPFFLAPLGADYAYTIDVDGGIVHVDLPVKVDFSVTEISGMHPWVCLPPYIGERVLRRGATSRLQSGTVEDIGLSVLHSIGDKLLKVGNGNLFSIRSDPEEHPAQHGDSGSLVLDSAATRGLLCGSDYTLGGLTYANNILDVMSALEIDAACNGGRRRMVRMAIIAHLMDIKLIEEHVGKFDRFRAEYLSQDSEGNLASALGALLNDGTGQAIAGAILADEEFSGLLNRAIGTWLVRPTIFDMLEYQIPENFTPDLLAAFSRLNAMKPDVIDMRWLEDAFQDADGRSMRELLDRSVKKPDLAVS
ncbi:hypothetical protein ACFCYI_10020 [Streptomyces sp. NPDC056257]|uniref:hypothetical protein n=1 Tax=Streptomyces sp. NPDC056257 TaxID=3345765 RepID=UPI0035E3AB00